MGQVARAMIALDRPPTRQAEAWAIATVLTACRSGRIGLDEAEDRLGAIYAARTFAELYAATSGLPHPPAPLTLEHARPGPPAPAGRRRR